MKTQKTNIPMGRAPQSSPVQSSSVQASSVQSMPAQGSIQSQTQMPFPNQASALDRSRTVARPQKRIDEEKRQAQNHAADGGGFIATTSRETQSKPTERRQRRMQASDLSAPKNQTNVNILRHIWRLSDIFWITATIMFGLWNAYIGINGRGSLATIAAGCVGAVSFISMLFAMQAYQFKAAETYSLHIKKVLLASAAALGIWLTFALIVRPETFLPNALAMSGIIAISALIILHTVYFVQAKSLHEKGALTPTIVMLGATESARRIIEENAKTRELNIVGIFDERLSRAPLNIHGVPVVGKIQDLLEWEDLPYIDRVVVTLPSLAEDRKKEFLEQVRLLPNRIAFVVDEFEKLDHVHQRLSEIAEISLRDVTDHSKSSLHTMIKRAMDLSISAVALILGAPFLLLIALLIKLDSPGPVLFKQPRHGFNNRVFNVFKFRSMRIETEDKEARKQVTQGDNRITKLGRFIRKTSIDELPQLLNVLKGDMSLVGPRPHAVGMHTGDIESYKLVEEYAHRHRMKPGMTGWAQINGSRGPLHNAQDVARRVQLDIEYIERSSAVFDLMIMLKTLPCLLGDRENIR